MRGSYKYRTVLCLGYLRVRVLCARHSAFPLPNCRSTKTFQPSPSDKMLATVAAGHLIRVSDWLNDSGTAVRPNLIFSSINKFDGANYQVLLPSYYERGRHPDFAIRLRPGYDARLDLLSFTFTFTFTPLLIILICSFLPRSSFSPNSSFRPVVLTTLVLSPRKQTLAWESNGAPQQWISLWSSSTSTFSTTSTRPSCHSRPLRNFSREALAMEQRYGIQKPHHRGTMNLPVNLYLSSRQTSHT